MSTLIHADGHHHKVTVSLNELRHTGDQYILSIQFIGEKLMLIVHVFVHVKTDHVKAFMAATVDNASNSVQEPGIARFDVIQQADDPTKFVLVEVYRNADAPAHHKETDHYLRWRDTVAHMMAEPRQSIKYTNIFPADADW